VTCLIGIDCATQPRKVGLTRGHLEGVRVIADECICGGPDADPAEIVAAWIGESETALLALDAPLGWASALGPSLASHQAGVEFDVPANSLFRRLTDNDIAARLGKRPLEVGANLISRTSVAAVDLLGKVRSMTGEPVPLAWSWPSTTRVSAIEVYPAATRIAHGAPAGGGRADGLTSLQCDLDLDRLSVDARDSLVCLVAAADFVLGRAIPPIAVEQQILQEGWIWAASRGS
jgi:hypothetical protein